MLQSDCFGPVRRLVRSREPADEGVSLSLCAFQRNRRLQARQELQLHQLRFVPPVMSRRQFLLHGQWRPKVWSLQSDRGAGEFFRSNADNRDGHTVHYNSASENERIAVEAAAPEGIAENNCRRC